MSNDGLITERFLRHSEKIDACLENTNRFSEEYLKHQSIIATLLLSVSPVTAAFEFDGEYHLWVIRIILFVSGWILLIATLIFHSIDNHLCDVFWRHQLEKSKRFQSVWGLARKGIIDDEAAEKLETIIGLGWDRSPKWPRILQTITLLIGVLSTLSAVTISIIGS